MNQEKLERLLDLAFNSGRVFVAADVFAALQPHLDEQGRISDGIRFAQVQVSEYLDAGTMIAIDETAITKQFYDPLNTCLRCGGSGGGDEPHLRCRRCHGTGSED